MYMFVPPERFRVGHGEKPSMAGVDSLWVGSLDVCIDLFCLYEDRNKEDLFPYLDERCVVGSGDALKAGGCHVSFIRRHGVVPTPKQLDNLQGSP